MHGFILPASVARHMKKRGQGKIINIASIMTKWRVIMSGPM